MYVYNTLFPQQTGRTESESGSPPDLAAPWGRLGEADGSELASRRTQTPHRLSQKHPCSVKVDVPFDFL